MKKIIEIENARKSQEAFEKAAIQRDLYWGYWNSKEYGNVRRKKQWHCI